MSRHLFVVACLFAMLVVGCKDDRPPPIAPDAGLDAAPDALPVCDEPIAIAEPGGCVRDSECGGATCRLDLETAPVDLAAARLVCGAPVGTGDAGARCATSTDCARGLCTLAGTCVPPCATTTDCAAGDRCATVYVRTGDTIHSRVSACIPTVRLLPDIEVLEEVRLDALLEFEAVSVPVGAAPIPTLHVLEATCERKAFGTALTTQEAEPRVLFEFDLIETSVGPSNGLNPIGRPLTVLFPNGELDLANVPGFDVEIVADGRGDVRITTLRGERDGGSLDLDLFFVEGSVLYPASDRLPFPVTIALERAETILQGAGIRFGEIRTHVIRGGIAEKLAIIEVDDEGFAPELAELYRLSAGAATGSVPIFFVALVENALGISGGAPGPHGMHGTTGSGIAVSSELLDRQADLLGNVLAHEIGHFLGLFHTTEMNGAVLDPFSDTPICPSTRDLDESGTLTAEECADFGGDNLMFWESRSTVLSPQQRAQLGRALVLTP